MPYNVPKFLIFVGCINAAAVGSCMPLTGVILSKLLTYMTAPWELLDLMG